MLTSAARAGAHAASWSRRGRVLERTAAEPSIDRSGGGPGGIQRAFPEVGPANVKGIELNPLPAALARVSVWVGEIQWLRPNGFAEAHNPILKPLDTIECRDAILDACRKSR